MTTATETLVAKIYIGLFGRAPDPAGLDYWTGEINNRVKARVDLDTAFATATSAEKAIRLRTITNDVMKSFTNAWILDNQGNPTAEWQAGNGQFDITTPDGAAGLVTQLYVNLFGRVPSGSVGDRSTEIGYWAGELSVLPTVGKFTPAEMIAALIAAADIDPNGPDAITMGYKASAASYYAERIGNSHSDAAARDAVVNVTSPSLLAASQQQTDAIAPANNNGQFLIGTVSPDSIIGTSGRDTLVGEGSGDNLNGGRGNDFVDGGAGDDLLLGGAGNDSVFGFSGNDTLVGGTGADTLRGEAGEDVFDFSDTLFNDPVAGLGSASFDALDVIDDFEAGKDTILLPDAFYQFLNGERVGTDGQFFRSTSPAASFTALQLAAEQSLASAGGVYVGAVANDTYVFFDDLGDGYGTVIKVLGVSSLSPGDFLPNSASILRGTNGNDDLVGSDANDIIEGLSGNDTLTGGNGSDVLTGGSGSDVFAFDDQPFNDSPSGNGFDYLDVIVDFQVGSDRIRLGNAFNGRVYDENTTPQASVNAVQQLAQAHFAQFGGGVFFGVSGGDGYLFFDDANDGFGTVIQLQGVTNFAPESVIFS